MVSEFKNEMAGSEKSIGKEHFSAVVQHRFEMGDTSKKLNSITYTKKLGQTVLCERTGGVYRGLRHCLHRNDATNDCNVTIDIFAHKQENVGWRLLCVTHDHDDDKTTAQYIGEQYNSLNEILSNAFTIVESTGYL